MAGGAEMGRFMRCSSRSAALQKELAKDITIRVHSQKDYQAAIEASEILFGTGTTEGLQKLSETDLLSVFEGVPQFSFSKDEIEKGINIIEFLGDKTNIFPSKGEARKMIQGGGVFLNKVQVIGFAHRLIQAGVKRRPRCKAR